MSEARLESPAGTESGAAQPSLAGFGPAPRYHLEITETPKRIKIVFNGELVASTRRARVLRETRLAPVYYLPREDVRMDLLRRSDHHTHCPFKGNASYWDLTVAGKTAENAVWSYEDPLSEVAALKNYVAFYSSKIDGLYAEGDEVSIDAGDSGHMRDNPLVDWLMREAWEAATSEELIARFTRRLVEGGVPLFRLNVLIGTLNPQVVGTAYVWKRDSELSVTNLRHEVAGSSRFRDSPFVPIYEGLGGIRRRLDAADAELDFPILKDLQAEGATDYVAMPLHFSDGHINVITLASDRPGGFSTEELGHVYEILPVLSRLLEVQALRHTMKSLLHTYLGAHSGELVLNGRVRRGDGESIPAVIWFCDLRDSTGLAERLPREMYLSLLNDFFDSAAGAVLNHGGEVLKFIGDAVLAIFPVKACEIETAKACDAAIAAAKETRRRVAELNRVADWSGKAELRFGLGLHLGDVTYGNVGAAQRLDFTVIGPAANEAARLGALCKKLDQSILLSESIVRQMTWSPPSLGRHSLRGVGESQEIFALPDSEELVQT